MGVAYYFMSVVIPIQVESGVKGTVGSGGEGEEVRIGYAISTCGQLL